MDQYINESSTVLSAVTADIVAAYVRSNGLPSNEVPNLIAMVHAALATLGQPSAPASKKAAPAAVRKSIRPDTLVSFIDNKPYKTLKRHLRGHGMTPQSYRSTYGLPTDYPMISADYSAVRSEMARSIGLGRVPDPSDKPARSRRKASG